jgi:hypothetical protein
MRCTCSLAGCRPSLDDFTAKTGTSQPCSIAALMIINYYNLILLWLQALEEHLSLMSAAFFEFKWDDTVEVTAAVHAFTPASDEAGGVSLGIISHASPSQRVPWAPQSLQLTLQRGATYLLAAPARCLPLPLPLTLALRFFSAFTPSLAFTLQCAAAALTQHVRPPQEIITSHAVPYQPEDVPGSSSSLFAFLCNGLLCILARCDVACRLARGFF